MTVIIECEPPFVWKPVAYHGDIASSYCWLWFGITILKVPLDEFASKAFILKKENE